MDTLTPDEIIDCTGLHCPLPMIKARRAIRNIDAGQTLAMTATDHAVVNDVQHWVKQEHHHLVVSQQREDGIYYFLIRKAQP